MAGNEEFIKWLIEEMENRGWNNSELARRARLVPSTVQQVVTGTRNPGVEFCLGVARAFRMPPELVFRQAGLLPSIDENVEEALYQRLRAFVEELSPERREELLHYVMFLHDLEYKRVEDETRDKSDKKS